jgi:hypothetical protein
MGSKFLHEKSSYLIIIINTIFLKLFYILFIIELFGIQLRIEDLKKNRLPIFFNHFSYNYFENVLII